MERINEEKGISDILAITFMVMFAIFAGVLLHAYRSDAIFSATDRQLQLKTEYLYRTLELSQVENYSLTYFQGVAENLLAITDLVVPTEVLQDGIENVLEYIRPSGYGALIKLEYENELWEQVSPSGTAKPGSDVAQFKFNGKVTIIIAEAGENRVAQVSADVTLFKL